MIRITIPPIYQEGIDNLISLSENEADKLVDSIEKSTSYITPKYLIDEIIDSVGIERSKLLSMIEALYSLYQEKIRVNIPNDEFVEGLLEAIMDSSNKGDKEFIGASANLVRFLSVEKLILTNKAINLELERQKIYRDARIISDLRPVFHEEAEDGCNDAIIIHSLKIEYLENRKRREIYIAMDSQDINDLKKLLNRAETKEKHLTEVSKSNNIEIIKIK